MGLDEARVDLSGFITSLESSGGEALELGGRELTSSEKNGSDQRTAEKREPCVVGRNKREKLET